MVNILQNYLPLPKSISPGKAFLLCFFLGPVVLMVFYYISVTNALPGSEYRGLFQFYSATFGDFIILPLGWYLVSKFYHAVNEAGIRLKRSMVIAVAAYAIGIILSTLVTLAGVYGANRDWTLPAQGEINLAGIYHSFFMALVLGTFWHFSLDYWAAVRMKPMDVAGEQGFEKPTRYYWLVLNLLTAFLVLLWADNIYAANPTVASYFMSNIIEQVSWFGFIFVNMYFSVRLNLIPKDKAVSWAVKQFAVLLLLSSLGVILVA